MTRQWFDGGPVVVGVDGSHAALNAVRWACDEALAGDVCLRLVHAVCQPSGSDDAVLMHAKRHAVATKRSLRVETASVVGLAGDVLVRESKSASMVCIGSRVALGPTATMLAEGADCPVAVIRTGPDGASRTGGAISVVLSDEEGNDDVVHLAMHEGRLRHATVRQIDLRADSWIRRYPDVHVEVVSAGTGRQYDREPGGDMVGMAVVGRRDAQELAAVGTPNCHPIPGYPDCSLLLVRS